MSHDRFVSLNYVLSQRILARTFRQHQIFMHTAADVMWMIRKTLVGVQCDKLLIMNV